jgi:hypothetical protein
MIRSFFVDGPAVASLPEPAEGPGLEKVPRVRIVLLDGLSLAHADGLVHLDEVCERGLRLVVDSGFPTVSSPVQAVLWTGQTQQQTGLWYRATVLSEPPTGSIPARVPGSVAVAESHEFIVNSYGFASTRPMLGQELTEAQFLGAAKDAVASDARLAFVHVLRIDDAGHDYGGASPQYADAAAWAGNRLVEWVALAPDAAWLVLADHGHLPGGGHGGAEEEIRLTRACLLAPLPSDLPDGRDLHLVDLNRVLSDLLGLSAWSGSAGRTLGGALAAPAPAATLPRPSTLRWSWAVLVLMLSLGLSRWSARRGWLWAPWWVVLAYAGVLAVHGRPTLSNPVVFPPWGSSALLAASPGFVVLVAVCVRLARHTDLARIAAAQLAPIFGLALACAILSGAASNWLGIAGGPPLMPTWSGQTSVALSLCAGAAVVFGLLSVAVAAGRKATQRG